MFRIFVLAALASLATPASAATVSFDGFDGLVFFSNGTAVEIEDPITGNLATGRGSPFFEMIAAGPQATQTVDGFGSSLATPRTCFGNNQFAQPRAGLLPCFVTDLGFETTYALVVEGTDATLEIFAANSTDPMAFLLGQTETRLSTSSVIASVPLPASLAVMLTALCGLAFAARRRNRSEPG